MKEFLEIVLVITGLVLGMFLLIFIIVTPFQWISCKNYTNITGTETKYSIIQSECFLKMQGKWIPYEKWVNISGEIK